MSIELKEYSPVYEREMKEDVIEFFAFHGGLVGQDGAARAEAEAGAAETLRDWQADPSALYVILEEGAYAGFLRLEYRGPQAAWIEDLYVRPERRGRGTASRAIGLAEGIVAQRPGCTAVCMDVAPRNGQAVKLYHRLGYDSVSLITLRKELGENPRDRKAEILGWEFHI